MSVSNELVGLINLPKVEMMTFDGDPLKYWLFMRAFENVIESNTTDNGARLARLLHYCKGKALRVIESCVMLHPDVGYVRAKELLKSRFGDDFVIAQAWLSKVAVGGPVAGCEHLQEFADELRGCLNCLQAMGYVSEVNTQSVLVKIAQRLPQYLKTRWVREVQHLKRRQGSPSIDDLIIFVEGAAEEANDPVFGGIIQNANPNKASNVLRAGNQQFARNGRFVQQSARKVGSTSFNTSVTDQTQNCKKCHSVHNGGLFGCDEFKALSVADRRKFATESKLCFNCLKSGHFAGSCRLQRTCPVDGCGKKHTKFLHLKSQGSNEQHPEVAMNRASCGAVGMGVATRIALPVVAVNVRADDAKQPILTYALLDPGSTNTFCSQDLAGKLGVKGLSTTLSLATLEQPDKKVMSTVTSLEIAPAEGGIFYKLTDVFTTECIPVKTCHVASRSDVCNWPHLKDLSLSTNLNGTDVSLLIGQDHPDLLLAREVREGGPGQPYATRTRLGWAIGGPMNQSTKSRSVTMNFLSASERLERQVERFWKIEDWEGLCSSGTGHSVEDKMVLDIWEGSICQVDGHYELAIPFRNREMVYPDSQPTAECRLHGLKRRLKRNPDLHQRYTSVMSEMISKGYAEEVTTSTVLKGPLWYLPHHPVITPKKVRIVFDCASQVEGKSLNSYIMQGPDIANRLIGVLARARLGPVAIMADIEAMFHQVKVSPDDRDALRFLWWPDGRIDEEPHVYRMTSHLFGGNWSPACCGFALRRNAKEKGHRYSQTAVDVVMHNFYVDDCFKAVDSEEEAIQLITELRALLAEGGFNLTKWASNRKAVVRAVPEKERAKSLNNIDLEVDGLPDEKTLGLTWRLADDEFTFQTMEREKPATRRGMLSVVSAVFDPLGFLSPFLLKARLVIQDLTRMKLGWDETPPDHQLSQWREWRTGLEMIRHFSIKRCVRPQGAVECQLHHFSDASQFAYGTVTYFRVVNQDGSIDCTLIMSKSRLAPLKTMSIPRLELSAAALAVRVDSMLQQELNLDLKPSVFWTDSAIVLGYIHNTMARYHTFVANRISAIRDGSVPEQWRHVASADNPADDVSRGLTATEIVTNERWLLGPRLLYSAEDWSQECHFTVDANDSELKKPALFMTGVSKDRFDLLARLDYFSSWFRMKRAVAAILMLKSKLRRGKSQHTTVQMLTEAEGIILKEVQKKAFTDEIGMLSSIGEGNDDGEQRSVLLKKRSPLYCLDPFLDEKGLIRVGGRVKRASIPRDVAHPVVLPKRSHVTELIVSHFHVKSGHSGTNTTLNEIRASGFWVLKGRTVVAAHVHRCVTCRKLRGVALVQKMSDLPPDRLEPSPPFTYSAVDFFGPFLVKEGRSEKKRWGAMFVCMASRAIHIEIAHSLSTDSFINAYRRFVGRRGPIRQLRCDRGTNFVGAKNELLAELEGIDNETIRQKLLKDDCDWIEFKMNFPHSSHMGGAWERLIRCARNALASLLAKHPCVLDDELLHTLMVEAELIVNSRPLTYMGMDEAGSMEPLTPIQLLTFKSKVVSAPPSVFVKEDVYCKKRWRCVQYLADQFWRRWRKEYLPTLQERRKWQQPQQNLANGDIVLLIDENAARCVWPRAIVIDTYPSEDALVRKVKVKTKDSTFERPVHKLVLLYRPKRTAD